MKTKFEYAIERDDHLGMADALRKTAENEDRQLTEEESAEIDRHIKDAESADAQFKKIEKDEERARKIAQMQDEAKKVTRRVDSDEPRGRIEHSGEPEPWEKIARLGSQTAFKGPNAKRDAYLSGQWLLGKIAPQGSITRARAEKICRNYSFFSDEERAMSITVNSAGGFLVPTPLSNTIIELRETYGVFRQYARVYPMSSDSEQIPRFASGTTAYYVGEGADITESTAAWDMVTLTARKLGILTKMSSEVSEDAVISLAAWVAQDMARQFAYQEDLAGFIGDGTATYGSQQGVFIKLYTDSAAIGAIDATATHDSLSEVTVDDLAQLVAVLPEYARPNAKWYCSAAAKAVIFDSLAMAAGGNNVVDFGNGPVPAFWGYPIVVSQVCPASLTAAAYDNKVMVVLGDLQLSSTLGSRSDIRIKILDQLYAASDQIGITGIERYCIVNHNVGDATNPGAVVGLVGQA